MASNTGRKRAAGSRKTAGSRGTTKKRDIGAEMIEALEEAIAFERGEETGATFRPAAISARNAQVDPAPQFDKNRVAQLRRRLHMTQPVFAQLLSVSPETVKGWEQGRFVPQGAANRLLQICQDCPDALLGVAHLLTAGGTNVERRSGRDRRQIA